VPDPSQDLDFLSCISWSFFYVQLKSDCSHFIVIGGIVDHHCLNFLFMTSKFRIQPLLGYKIKKNYRLHIQNYLPCILKPPFDYLVYDDKIFMNTLRRIIDRGFYISLYTFYILLSLVDLKLERQTIKCIVQE
jgi:hypothetical protein